MLFLSTATATTLPVAGNDTRPSPVKSSVKTLEAPSVTVPSFAVIVPVLETAGAISPTTPPDAAVIVP